jgi:hypothetical protein
MKSKIIFACLILALVSCNKGRISCTAFTANGDKMYEVKKSDKCESQINKEAGEYCECYK